MMNIEKKKLTCTLVFHLLGFITGILLGFIIKNGLCPKHTEEICGGKTMDHLKNL